jgi:hypothetical protein
VLEKQEFHFITHDSIPLLASGREVNILKGRLKAYLNSQNKAIIKKIEMKPEDL